MKFKPVPDPPDTLDGVHEVRRAVPRVPAPESDCCARVMARVSWIASREQARDWLTMLRALGLVERGPTGLRRTPGDVGRRDLADRFLDGVHGADRVLEAVCASTGPVDSGAVVERGATAPAWERHRHDDWRRVWRERIDRLLEWFVLLGIAERHDGRYDAVTGTGGGPREPSE